MNTLPPALKGKKISETFMDYVEPYLKFIMSDGSVDTLKKIEVSLRLPWTIWNAIVVDKLKPGSNFLSLVEQSIPDHSREIVKALKDRKEKLFYQYDYMFGEFSLYLDEDGQEVRVRVEARKVPESLITEYF